MYTWIWETYIIIAAIGAVYFISAFYFYTQRNKVSFLTRSPITVCISLTMLGIDSILNTFIFSDITWGDPFHFNCNLGVVATVFGQFGFMLATGLRIYRIVKVYDKYLMYLDT